MRVAARLRKPSVRRRLLVAAVLVGCFVWAMVVVGLSFAVAERGSPHWWVMPPFGVSVLAIAVFAVLRIPAAPTGAGDVPAGPTAPDAARSRPPVAATRRLPEPLSPREMEVLEQLAAGHSNVEIAKALFVAPGTVKAHLHHIFGKLQATSRLQAVTHAREAGLID